MGVSIFYLLACLPLGVGFYLMLRGRGVNLQEWLGGSAIGFLLAGLIHLAAVRSMTDDVETWSGQIVKATHHPRWVEEYFVTHYIHDSKGVVVGSYTTAEYLTHDEYWDCDTSIPDSHNITHAEFDDIQQKFNNLTTEQPHKSGFYSGDENIYVAYNRTGYAFPVTAIKHWENRVKAAPSLFSFAKVPPDVKVFGYPRNGDWRKSDRLFGTAAITVDILEFDRMNARLGPRKLVNVILCGFGNRGIDAAGYQQAAWIGGKKNDIVLCYGGGDTNRAGWARVFGWSDSEVCKRNLETLLLSQPVNTALLPALETEIVRGYNIKDWSRFDYLTVEPPRWSYWTFCLLLIASQIGWWWWAVANEF